VNRGKETELTGADTEGRAGRKDAILPLLIHSEPLFLCIFLPLENNLFKAFIFFQNIPDSYWLAPVIGPNTLCIRVTFFTLRLLFYPEDRVSTLLQNTSKYLSDYKASHPRRQ
jgi:hypothetical protein